MDATKRKELKNAYKSKPVIGGVCCTRCSGNGRIWLQATRDVESLRNRFAFAKTTRCCPDPSMRADWEKYGIDAFSFEVLEELKKREEQTPREFADDLNLLYEIWLEKSQQGEWTRVKGEG